MFKLLLCWRYLRTRYIALASIVSVTLGVATMIVVNSVMAGFSEEMRDRIHGILSDIVFESHSLDGFYDPEARMAEIRQVAGEHIKSMTATVNVPAMLSYRYGGQWVTRQVLVVGIDTKAGEYAGAFKQYLQHPKNREQPSFELREDGYDAVDHQGGSNPAERPELGLAGRKYREWKLAREAAFEQTAEESRMELNEGRQRSSSEPAAIGPEALPPVTLDRGETDVAADPTSPRDPASPSSPNGSPAGGAANDPFAGRPLASDGHDPKEQHAGLILGFALATYRGHDRSDHFMVLPGDDVKLTLPTAGRPPRAIDDTFTIVDLYESKMNEYDSGFVFVPLDKLQQLRGMIDPSTGIGSVTSIQIKLKDESKGKLVRDKLREHVSSGVYGIYTWQDKQGPLLAAVQMETAILNLLLFLIIAVAGFGILAIFFMIVVEKTRDIGILKSLGASGPGIMSIFLGYGLSLGTVGSGAGMVLGLLFVHYINDIASGLTWLTGHEVFDPQIYYFSQIPTIVHTFTVTWIVLGAMAIAVMASILPARRASRLHPVEALRYE